MKYMRQDFSFKVYQGPRPSPPGPPKVTANLKTYF